jgi:hypothetical protein
LTDQIDKINAFESDHSSTGSTPPLGSVSGPATPTPVTPGPVSVDTTATCAQMQSQELTIAQDTDTLVQNIKTDVETTGTTVRTTTAARAELKAFSDKYSGLSCPDSQMTAASFVSQEGSALDSLDDLLRQIHGG